MARCWATAIAYDADLESLRRVWLDEGDLDKLLRDPLEVDPPSLLRGDAVFLPEIKKALMTLRAHGRRRNETTCPTDRPVEFVATVSLLEGRERPREGAFGGEDFGGFVISDRYAGYHFLDVLQQQLCWSHVIRQLVEVSERRGASGRLGRKLVGAAREVIAVHRRYLEDGHEPAWLAAELEPLRERIGSLLEQGERARHRPTARFCAGLLEEYEALWTFCEVPAIGIDPTNNAAERALRHAVIMRKDPARHPIRAGQPLDRADLLGA